MTFGNDASGESPIDPRDKAFSPSTVNSHQTHDFTQGPSYHSQVSSWDSVNSNTELLGADKVSHRPGQSKGILRSSGDTTSPSQFDRQVNGDVPLRTARHGVCSPRVSFVTRDDPPEPSTRGQQRSSMTSANANAPKELTFKSKAPPALNLPPLPHPLSTREIRNKSATLVVRLGFPAATTSGLFETSPVAPVQGNAKVSSFAVTPIPRIAVSTWSPESADEPNSRLPFPPISSLHTTSDSGDSGEVLHTPVRSLPQVPEQSDDEQDAAEDCLPSPRRMRARTQRTIMASIWSQESGRTLSILVNEEVQAACPHLMANTFVPDEGDTGGTIRRRTPSGPRACPKTPRQTVEGVSQCSVHIGQMSSPDNKGSTIVLAPNDNIV